MILRVRDLESDLETSQLLPCSIAKALIKFPDFCNEARCRQFSAKVSNSPNVITQPLQKVIFHQSSAHRIYFKDIFKWQVLSNAFGNSFDIITQPLQIHISNERIFSKVIFYHMLLTIHLTSSPNNSKSPKYQQLDIFCTRSYIQGYFRMSNHITMFFDNFLYIITQLPQKVFKIQD